MGPLEVEFGTAKKPGAGPQFRVGTVTAGRSLKIKNLTVENKNSHATQRAGAWLPREQASSSSNSTWISSNYSRSQWTTSVSRSMCLSHESNIEQVFSRAGLLADPNLLPAQLSMIVTVGFNRNAFKPQIAVIKDKYYEMFRNKTKS
jgi:hypothetical protein